MNQLTEKIKSKSHIIWDWNGTLLDDLHHAVNIINQILVDHHLKPTSRAEYQESFTFPVRNYYQKLGFNFEQHSFESISHRFVETYMKTVLHCRMFQHSLPLLQVAVDHDLVQSILSASDQDSLNFVVKNYKIEDFFDHVMGIEDKLATSKLHKGKELIQKSLIPASETLLIGDTEHDLEVGQELGVEVVLIAHGHNSLQRLQKKHHQVYQIQ